MRSDLLGGGLRVILVRGLDVPMTIDYGATAAGSTGRDATAGQTP